MKRLETTSKELNNISSDNLYKDTSIPRLFLQICVGVSKCTTFLTLPYTAILYFPILHFTVVKAQNHRSKTNNYQQWIQLIRARQPNRDKRFL